MVGNRQGSSRIQNRSTSHLGTMSFFIHRRNGGKKSLGGTESKKGVFTIVTGSQHCNVPLLSRSNKHERGKHRHLPHTYKIPLVGIDIFSRVRKSSPAQG